MTSLAKTEQIFRLHDDLVIQADIAGPSKTLTDFFTGYDRAFVLPGEKESLEGFEACLAMNFGDAYDCLSQRYGPYREVVFTAAVEGIVVGGGNFICYTIASRAELAVVPDILSINLNYIFVDREFRGRGYFRRILAACPGIATLYLKNTAAKMAADPMRATLIFTEQNDPIRMNPDDYRLDNLHSGLDQIERLAIWATMGAQIIDFPYVQPALSEDQAAFDDLVLAVIGADRSRLSAWVLHEHLRRFFAISVLKGIALERSAIAQRQLEKLNTAILQHRDYDLLDAGGWAKQHCGKEQLSLRDVYPDLLSALRAQKNK